MTVAHGRLDLRRRIVTWIPSGSQLAPENQQRRHRLILSTLATLIPILTAIGIINHRSPRSIVNEVGLAVALPLCITLLVKHTRLRSSLAALGLMSSAAVLVDLSGGKVEAHFLFFVLLPLVALYQDWVPFLVAVGVVVGHHALIGTFAPNSVYDHLAAQHSPVLWAIIHASFIVALIGVLVIYWNASEAEERSLRQALQELKQAQDQLVQAQKLESLGQMAAGVAHEINTPIQFVGDNIRFLDSAFQDLTTLCANLNELIDVAKQQPDLKDVADRADAQRTALDIGYLLEEIPLAVSQSLGGIERVAEIVRALKGVAHPESDKIAPIDLNALIADTIIVSRNEWRYAAELTTHYDDELPMVGCAAGPIGQVVLNLVTNASHAIQERFGNQAGSNGKISISTIHDDHYAILKIADNGNGIPDDVKARIFDPFFTTKGVGRGTGQGLAISRTVVTKQHDGTIDVDSTPGQGTSFTIRIPLQHASLALGVVSRPADFPGDSAPHTRNRVSTNLDVDAPHSVSYRDDSSSSASP